MTAEHRNESATHLDGAGDAHDLGLDRTHVFVPAIMGVGLVFWILGELRDLLRSEGAQSRHKRARLAGRSWALQVPSEHRQPLAPEARGLRPRPVYLLWAVALIGGACYVAIGSIRNFQRHGGYVSDISWLLALALVVSGVLAVLGAVALAVFVVWPRTPQWCEHLLNTSLLTTSPVEPGTVLAKPPWRTTSAFLMFSGAAALACFIVAASTAWVQGFDNAVADWFVRVDLTWWAPITNASYGWFGVGALVVVAALAGARCRAVSTVYVGASALALLVTIGLHSLITRARPGAGPLSARAADSFPNGHLVQATLIATLFPLVVLVLAKRRIAALVGEFLLGALATGAAIASIARSEHWPSDVIAGALIGLALGFGGRWLVADQRSHVRCRNCPWLVPGAVAALPHRPHHREAHQLLGLWRMADRQARLARLAAHATSLLVVVLLALLSFTIGLPRNEDAYVFGPSVQRPLQIGLAALVSVAALLGRRRPALGAVVMALSACGLGVVASVEYAPLWSAALAATVMVPAFLLWLSWQHRKAPHELAAVAVVTIVLVGSTWFGARAMYDTYFGPTHPASAADSISVDEVEWVLAGGLQAESIMVNARLVHPKLGATLLVTAEDGSHAVESPQAQADEHGIVHLRAEGLVPGTRYRFRVVVNGSPDRGRGFGEFRTPVRGPMTFDVVVASCARSGSNGAVFDAMANEDALLYLALGDAHYGNLDSTSINPFLEAYRHLLTRPGQAAFFRSTPMAYVWDDHDYGPNDADSTSPGRAAAAAAYRAVVPALDLVDDIAVYQAFTIGRVRFVMTDGRSQRTATTLLGEQQLSWLIDELTTSSRTHALVVWANDVPWIGTASPGADGWAGYATERTRIADALAGAQVDNLVMVAGDAHMVAIDDGTNTDYSTDGSGFGFPLLQAAALDRRGDIKGGPYSDGAFPGGGQYGMLQIADRDSVIDVTLSGRTWEGRILVSHTFAFPQTP